MKSDEKEGRYTGWLCCPCGALLYLTDAYDGKRVNCKYCGAMLTIEKSESANGIYWYLEEEVR